MAKDYFDLRMFVGIDIERRILRWITNKDVTECTDETILDEHLDRAYEALCDPRLNAGQSLDLAFQLSELLHAR